MKWKVFIVLAAIPLLLANANDDRVLLKRFLTTTESGAAYLPDDFVELPTGDVAAFLVSLKGCKNKTVETVSGQGKTGYGMIWRCREKPKTQAAVVYLQNGKIRRILPSAVSAGRTNSSVPLNTDKRN